MTTTEAKTEKEKEFIHTKKGSIWGRLIGEVTEFANIELSRPLKGKYKDYAPGEQIQIRVSLLEKFETKAG